MRAATACATVAIIAAVSPVVADDPVLVRPTEFLETVEGRTVHYSVDGKHYGTERFYGKGRATWKFPGGNCEDGTYWTVESEICFRYGTSSCWSVFGADDSAGVAVSRDGFRVGIERIDNAPLRCEGNPVS